MLAGPHGPIEWTQFGMGEPTTVFAHGLAGSIAGTRPFASGVPGRRVFFHFRGHGRREGHGRVHGSAFADAERHVLTYDVLTYDVLADELAAVADHTSAGQALGVSMGAGALCALLAREPRRFTRAVLVLPIGLDRPRDPSVLAHFSRLAKLVETGDATALADALAGIYGEDVAQGSWALERAIALLETDVAAALRWLPARRALPDRFALAKVTIPVLVIAQHGDPVHPVDAARALAEVLPFACLETLPPGGLLSTHRVRLRSLVGAFLKG